MQDAPATLDVPAAAAVSAGTSALPPGRSRSGSIDSIDTYSAVADSFGAAPPASAMAPTAAAAPDAVDAPGNPSKLRYGDGHTSQRHVFFDS